MAQLTLTVGGRGYQLACRDGEEAHLRDLARMVDARAEEAASAVGTANEARQLLLAALLLADELNDLKAGAADPAEVALAGTLATLAQRIETLADRLEKDGQTS